MTEAQVLEQDLVEAMAKARTNLVNFRHITLQCGDRQVAPALFHFQWSKILLEGTGHVGIEGFRESAKDQIISRAFPLYAMTFPQARTSYIIILRANDTLAAKNIVAITEEYFNNPLIRARHKKTLKRSENCLSVIVEDDNGNDINIIIEGYGKGSSIRGLATRDRRPDIVILNDIQDLEDAKSDTIMAKDWDWFLSDVKFLGKYTRIFAIGNNLGDKCIMEQIDANKSDLGFDFFRIPIMEEGRSTWPANYTVEQIIAERESYRRMGKLDIWLRERMCQSSSEETRIFKKEYKRTFNLLAFHNIQPFCNGAATLDPATSKSPESCYRSIVVRFTDEENNWFVTDCKFGRWDIIALMDNMFDTVSQWKIRRFGVEKGMLKDWLETLLLQEMKKRNIFFEIIPLEHAKEGTKLERIKALQPRWKSGQILLPDEAPWVAEMETELEGVTKDEIKSKFIDCVDALAMHTQIDIRPMGRQTASNLPRESV
jgi:predicted phage terminase large subunit-like protein